MVDKDFYNEASAAKLGWDPSWFELVEYDSRLVKKIRAFQREIGLTADGMLGPKTFRRLVAHREAQEDETARLQVRRLISSRGALFCHGHGCFAPWGRCGTPVSAPRSGAARSALV